MAILDNNLLVAEREFHNGIKSIPRYASGPGDAQDLTFNGSLESCGKLYGIYVAEGNDSISKNQ